jgi:hypothetical protein
LEIDDGFGALQPQAQTNDFASSSVSGLGSVGFGPRLFGVNAPSAPASRWRPPHTNGSENDIRCQVTKRQVSGGTRSGTGRDCRDAFSVWPRLAASLVSSSGTISAPGSVSLAVPQSRRLQTSSAAAAVASLPDAASPGVFCPDYESDHQGVEIFANL